MHRSASECIVGDRSGDFVLIGNHNDRGVWNDFLDGLVEFESFHGKQIRFDKNQVELNLFREFQRILSVASQRDPVSLLF